MRIKEENAFIFSYIATGNYLIIQKFKVLSNNASNCIQLIDIIIIKIVRLVYIWKIGNCAKIYTCPYKYFYQIIIGKAV